MALCDGSGWDSAPRAYNSRLLAIAGDPQHASFEELPGYPELLNDFYSASDFTRYYGFGTLAVDGSIYQFLSTPNHAFDGPDPRFVGAKLISSADGGATWRNQDGSTPVVWERWEERSRENMAFFEEPQDAFSLLSVLQMGRDYAANEDGYVYVYAPNGSTEGTMNELVMFRVPKGRVTDRRAYEYFGGLDADGGARWAPAIEDREPVHVFPSGWVNTSVHPYAWHPSVTYNPGLDVYMMANWGMGCAEDGSWFGKPSYLGLWIASTPWGPWHQIHEETAWIPDADPAARAYQPQIAPKWIAEDGRSFWLVWTDFQQAPGTAVSSGPSFEALREALARAPSFEAFLEERAALRPFYAFNVQRVELVLAD